MSGRCVKVSANLDLDLSGAVKTDTMASSIATFLGFSSMPRVSKRDRAILESVVCAPAVNRARVATR